MIQKAYSYKCCTHESHHAALQVSHARAMLQMLQKNCALLCADGIEEQGSSIMYKANVRRILTEGEGDQLKAVGVQLLDGRTFKGQVNRCCVLS